MASVQLQHAFDYLTLTDNRNIDALTTLLSENFTHHVHPASFGMPSRNKQEFLGLLVGLKETFEVTNFQTPKDIIQSQDVVVLHTTSDGKLTSGNSYKNEYIFIIRFEGEKILSVKEFLDSKYTAELFERENAAKSKAT